MRFEYNTDLNFEERVALVRREIQDEYPLINDRDATVAAALAVPVDDKLTNDDKFDRYYFIMHTIRRGDEEFPHVFNDAFNLYQEGLEKEKYRDAMTEIMNYMIGDRDTFPELVPNN
jgi:hypothetical protein